MRQGYDIESIVLFLKTIIEKYQDIIDKYGASSQKIQHTSSLELYIPCAVVINLFIHNCLLLWFYVLLCAIGDTIFNSGIFLAPDVLM